MFVSADEIILFCSHKIQYLQRTKNEWWSGIGLPRPETLSFVYSLKMKTDPNVYKR